MSLQVIGSGFGRTGTMTMKQVLEKLGFGPCHHMLEIIENPEQLQLWKTVAAGGEIDWEGVFAGYRSQVDWPGAHVWQQTAAAFPEARIIHTERPEDAWWNSFNSTIGKFFRSLEKLDIPPHLMDQFTFMRGWLMQESFTDFTDREAAIAGYREHNRRVREGVPAERLLVFNVADGWQPLCDFLGAPVPDEPFPHTHARKEFWEHFGGEPG